MNLTVKTKLGAFAQVETEEGQKLIKVGDVSIWTKPFCKDDAVSSIEINLYIVPRNGKIFLQEE